MSKDTSMVKYAVLSKRVSWSLRLGLIATVATLILLLVLGGDSAPASVAGIAAVCFLMYAVGLKDADTIIYREEHKDEKESGQK